MAELPIVPTADAFRFATIRPATIPTTTVVETSFVTFDFFASISASVLSAIESTEPLLYTILVSKINLANPRLEMENAVNSFRVSSANYIANANVLYTSTILV